MTGVWLIIWVMEKRRSDGKEKGYAVSQTWKNQFNGKRDRLWGRMAGTAQLRGVQGGHRPSSGVGH